MLTTEDCLQLVLDSESEYEKEILKVFAKLPNTPGELSLRIKHDIIDDLLPKKNL